LLSSTTRTVWRYPHTSHPATPIPPPQRGRSRRTFTPRVAGETAAGRYATDGTVALWVPLTGAPGTLVDIVVLADVLTTNDGTHCWTATFAIVHTDNTTTDVVGAVTTTTTPDTLTVLPSVVAEPHVWIATDKAIICTISKTSTPGALAIGAWLKYQDTPA
jgi:hypothetical protein